MPTVPTVMMRTPPTLNRASGQQSELDRYCIRVILAVFAALALAAALLVSAPAVKQSTVGLSRNSEAFAFVGLTLIDALIGGTFRDRATIAWFVVLGAALLATETSAFGLPGNIVTLREPILAALLMGVFMRGSVRVRYVLIGAAAVVLVGELVGPEQEPGSFIVGHAEVFGSLIVGVVLFRRLMSWPDLKPWGSVASWIAVAAILVAVPAVCLLFNRNGVDSLAAQGAFETGLVWLQRNMESYVAGMILLVLIVSVRHVPDLWGRRPGS